MLSMAVRKPLAQQHILGLFYLEATHRTMLID